MKNKEQRYFETGSPELTIRFAEPEETGVVFQFIKELAVYEKMLDEVVATEELLHEWIFEKKLAEVLLAEWQGEIIGFALFFHNFSTFVGKGGIYLEDLFVRPEARGKGIGKALLKILAQLCIERKCGRMEWACLNWNEPSIRFYCSLGAQPMDEWKVYRLAGPDLKSLAES